MENSQETYEDRDITHSFQTNNTTDIAEIEKINQAFYSNGGIMPLKSKTVLKSINEDIKKNSSLIHKIMKQDLFHEDQIGKVNPIHRFSEYIDEEELKSLASNKKDSASEL